MGALVRKIELAKWKQKDVVGGETPSADAITACLRTRGNALSVWWIEDDSEFMDAVLAIASGGQGIDTIDVVTIPASPGEGHDFALTLSASDGRTPYARFSCRHRDVVDLDYDSLGTMATLVVAAIKEKRHRRFTARELRKLLTDAVSEQKISLECLGDGLRKELA